MRKWLRWTLAAVAALLVTLGAVYGIGMTLPVAHSASVSRVVVGSPDEVWSVMTDVESLASWRPNLDQAELLAPREGLPRWRESGPTGSMTLQVVTLEPPTRMVTVIADEGLPFGGTWTYELEATGSGTRVSLTENGEVYSPLFRFVSRFVMGHEATMRTYLDGLEARMASEQGR